MSSPFQCPICLQNYNDEGNIPVTFPCGHSCCLQHASQMRNCHYCRDLLPHFDSLSPNYALRDAALLLLSQQSTTAVADTVAASADIAVAVGIDESSNVADTDEFLTKSLDVKLFMSNVVQASQEVVAQVFPDRAEASYNEISLLASAISPDCFSSWRCPVDVVLVIDTSGSMGDLAVTQSAETSGTQLDLLDIVKHAANTIINALGPNDRISIVTFSDRASVLVPLSCMSDSDKIAETTEKLGHLDAGGGTNLYDGLIKAMDVLKSRSSVGSMKPATGSILLLTDGIPTPAYSPIRGIMPTLKKYKDTNGGTYPGIINSFGFGYSLDSELLREIAEEGGGIYSFIPDAGFVGTAFVNALSNILTSVAVDITLKIQLASADGDDSGVIKIIPNSIACSSTCTETSWGLLCNVSNILAGQDLDVLQFKLLVPANDATGSATNADIHQLVDAQLSYCCCKKRHATSVARTVSSTVVRMNSLYRQHVDAQGFRFKVIDMLTIALDDMCQANVMNTELIATMRSWVSSHTDLLLPGSVAVGENDDTPVSFRVSPYVIVTSLLADTTGQIKQALWKTEWYDKWGRHYLASLRRAHQLQQCNNFKDPGIQHYGGILNSKLKDMAEDTFNKLPPPVPRNTSYRRYDYPPQAPGRAGTFSMASYNNRDTGCIHEDGLVLLADGVSTKKCKDIRRGDVIYGGDTVECILATVISSGKLNMVHCTTSDTGNGDPLFITRWHPIKVNGAWNFPIDTVLVKCPATATAAITSIEVEVACSRVYSFLLTNRSSSMIINGISCITLAHGIAGDAVATHPYFGTELVSQSLKRCRGWTSSTGTIVFADTHDIFVRSSNTAGNLVSDVNYSYELTDA